MAAHTNRLIEALSPDARAQLLSVARAVELPQGTMLCQPDEQTAFAHFLTSGVASTVVSVPDGGSAETGMIGNEGIIGSIGLLGPHTPVSGCLMQLNGTGLRVAMSDMRRFIEESPEIRARVLESIQAQAITMNQIAACNKLHHAAERLSRWLLTASDRIHSPLVTLTQESLSQMLGTRRTTVALVAGTLQRSGYIRYRRGKVEILDREGLEEAACGCYGVTRRLVDQLYGGDGV